MRRASPPIAILAALAVAFALALTASADPGAPNASSSSPPGNNGTIKVHAGDTETEPIVANEPHPGCAFHIHGFNFDAGSTGNWTIVAWPPNGDGITVVASGTWTASAAGEWRTAVLSLASGHYKAFAKQDGAPGGQKQKMFWIECGAAAAAPAATPMSASTPTPVPTQLGFEQPPVAGVTPMVETSGTPTAVQGAEQAPVTAPGQPTPAQVSGQAEASATVAGLPSTSTLADAPWALAAIAPLAGLIWRRLRR